MRSPRPAAFAAPVLARSIDRRTIVIAATIAIVLSYLIAYLALSFPVVLIGYLILGLGVGALWTFAVGRRLVPDSAGARATFIISLGISAGTFFGSPLGRSSGHGSGGTQVWCSPPSATSIPPPRAAWAGPRGPRSNNCSRARNAPSLAT